MNNPLSQVCWRRACSFSTGHYWIIRMAFLEAAWAKSSDCRRRRRQTCRDIPDRNLILYTRWVWFINSWMTDCPVHPPISSP